jgi:predicted DNA-binding protein
MSDSNAPQFAPGAAGLESVALPHDVATMLMTEAKRNKKPVAEFLREWLEDQVDARESARIMKRVKDGKEKVHPAAEVWARLGI